MRATEAKEVLRKGVGWSNGELMIISAGWDGTKTLEKGKVGVLLLLFILSKTKITTVL